MFILGETLTFLSKFKLLYLCSGITYAVCQVQVWASKWNERAYFSTRKVKLDHDYLCMAVLVQEIINADYAFVIHTTNPSSGDSSEIYAEVLFFFNLSVGLPCVHLINLRDEILSHCWNRL